MWKFSLQWLSDGLSYEKYALKPKLEVLLMTFLLVLVITKLQKVVRHLIKLAKNSNDLSIFGENKTV